MTMYQFVSHVWFVSVTGERYPDNVSVCESCLVCFSYWRERELQTIYQFVSHVWFVSVTGERAPDNVSVCESCLVCFSYWRESSTQRINL